LPGSSSSSFVECLHEHALGDSTTHRANALCRVNEVVLERPDGCRGATSNADLLVDVLNVVAHGLGGDAEILGDLLIGSASHEDEENLELSVRQTGRAVARPFAHAMPGGAEHRVDCIRVEPSCGDLALKLRLGGRRVERGPVRPRLAHGSIAVGRRKDPRRKFERVSTRAAVIAGAVEPLVV
jgi:hypothetical protein